VSVDGLSDLLRDPAHVAKIPLETIPALLCQLAALQSALAARLLGETAPVGGPEPEADALLEVTEAARRLGTTRDWLYRHAHQLPFTVRMGPRQLRFSAKGIERYIRQRQGR
jgi:predicted DNA-binding transcriptional regulator AlpA